MFFIINKILGAFWFVSLLGIVNMAPFLVRGIKFLDVPVDFGKTWREKRIFGDNKTWRGILFAVLTAILWFCFQKITFEKSALIKSIGFFDYSSMSFLYALLVGCGVVLGDLVKSFFKRRVGIAPGKPWIPFDQIDYLLGGLALELFCFIPSILEIVLVFLLGIFLHIIFNLFGYFLRFKKEPF